jgi:hypothetical protein
MEEEQQQMIELEVHVSCGGMGVTTKDWTQSRHATKEHECKGLSSKQASKQWRIKNNNKGLNMN